MAEFVVVVQRTQIEYNWHIIWQVYRLAELNQVDVFMNIILILNRHKLMFMMANQLLWRHFHSKMFHGCDQIEKRVIIVFSYYSANDCFVIW